MTASISKSLLVLSACCVGPVLCARMAFAAGDAYLSASGMVLEETEDGIVLTLDGPVEASFNGDRISAASATVTLSDDLSSLEDAVESIQLTGRVTYSGADGASGRAGSATYHAQSGRIVLRGGAHFSRGEMSASAGNVDYAVEAQRVGLTGNCSITEGAVSAEADAAEYYLASGTGNLLGSVVVRYATGGILFGDEPINDVVMRAEALFVSVSDGQVKTPEGPQGGRTTIEAGGFTLTADSITFNVSEAGLSEVRADGNVSLTGPDVQYLNAGSLSFSSTDRIIRAGGDVLFSIRGHEGSARAIELNFPAGWSVRLLGASVGGTVEEEQIPEDEEASQEGDEKAQE